MSTISEMAVEESRIAYQTALKGMALTGDDPGMIASSARQLSAARAAYETEFIREVLSAYCVQPATRATDPMLQLFRFEHLKPEMQAISRPFCELARYMVDTLPRNPERTAALRKLREAKDCAVTASIWKE